MNLQPDDYEIIAFFGLVMLFEIGERVWPAQKINRLADVKLDVLSFSFALAVNRICNYIFRAAAVRLTPPHLATVVSALQSLPSALRIIIALFIVDFIIYWIHRAQHNYDVFWRTHAWHHSIEHMYWFSGFRTSFLHSFLYNIPQVVIPVTLFHLSPAEAGIGYSLGIFIQFVEHTNWKMSFGPLNWLLVTPDYHRVHHSATLHRGQNLAGTFRIWDRMFGTYIDPARMPEGYALGLGEPVDGKKIPRMLVGL
jgi:sterol desaturase/sphingolipid hydroxylase (fatty acid hydroxylase superfamily)